MKIQQTIVIFFNDWKVYPSGINSGGGEAATISLAKALYRLGYKVIACANLPEGDCSLNGIDFWDFGTDYNIARIIDRTKDIGDFYCIAASLVHPLILAKAQPNCKATILINHSPSPFSSGLEPVTVLKIVDQMVCVSQSQRNQLLIRGAESLAEKIVVIKNGFDPNIFSYAGPENRDWQHLVYIGRLEAPKGIHLLIKAYVELLVKFPNLKLSIFGDTHYWPEVSDKIIELQEKVPGLKLHGKVPQKELAKCLQSAGLLIFPSISFESAGLAIIDAQACGCPVVAFNQGGVAEYLIDHECGELLYSTTTDVLKGSIEKLLNNPQKLIEMSNNCYRLGTTQTWDKTASEIINLINKISSCKNQETSPLPKLPAECIRTIGWINNSVSQVSQDHEAIAQGEIISLNQINQYCEALSDYAAPFIWKGLVLEAQGHLGPAEDSYKTAIKLSSSQDWQALFLLMLLQLKTGNDLQAGTNAELLLKRYPAFDFSEQLKQIIDRINSNKQRSNERL